MVGKRLIKTDCQDACIYEVEIEHNGFQGGDCGHGGYVRLKMEACGYPQGFNVNGIDCETFELYICGDAERRNLIRSLKFFIEELESFPNLD